MSHYKDKLDELLEIKDDGWIPGWRYADVHKFAYEIMYNMLHNSRIAKRSLYYRECPAFKALLEDFRKNVPKNIYRNKELYIEHPCFVTWLVYYHAIIHTLIKLEA